MMSLDSNKILTKTPPNFPPSTHQFIPAPQLQQAFPGNPLAKPAREASRRSKQVGECRIIPLPPLCHAQSPSRTPSSVTCCGLSSLFAFIPRGQSRCRWNTLLSSHCGPPQPLLSSPSLFLTVSPQYLETHFTRNPPAPSGHT